MSKVATGRKTPSAKDTKIKPDGSPIHGEFDRKDHDRSEKVNAPLGDELLTPRHIGSRWATKKRKGERRQGHFASGLPSDALIT